MPSLIKFLVIAVVLAGVAYGAMVALVTFVQVTPRPMEQSVPAAKLNK